MDYGSLLQIAKINRHFSALSIDIFRRKYSKREIIIEDYLYCKSPVIVQPADTGTIMSRILTSIGKKPKKRKHSHCIFDDYIKIHHLDDILTTLKHFGSIIKRLKIQYFYMEANEAEMMAQYMDKYTSDSLIDIEFDSYYQFLLRYIKVPFKMAENVTFSKLSLSDIDDVALPMNQLFPSLRNLFLYSLENIDEAYINVHLPHLEHLTFDAEYLNYGFIDKEMDMIPLIKKNPQIKSINLINITPTFLEHVVGLLPNLKTLTLSLILDNIAEIHFENVTKFEAKESLMEPQNFLFSNLEELLMMCTDLQCDRWVTFVEKHRGLKQIQVQSSTLTDEQFKNLTNLTELEEVTILLTDYRFIGVEAISGFIESHDKLKRFELNSCRKIDKEALLVKFGMEWSIRDYDECLVFERNERGGSGIVIT